MNFRKPMVTVLTLLLALTLAGDVMADISNAAVLFLRIAPGSRAAGMGEAYVAIADDATATHWNPAGLGNHPLSDSWIETRVPQQYLPLTGFAPMSTGKTRNYRDYDIWAISPLGLIRYDNKSWHTEEVFSTRTDETVEGKVRNYFRLTDDALLATMVERVARVNNRGRLEELDSLRSAVLAAVPDTYDRYENLQADLDSMVACYLQCRVNWSRVEELSKHLREGNEDSDLKDSEIDRIAVAAERSRNRFLPEELHIPYNALFSGGLTAIASTGNTLLVGAADGLARYNGENWEFSLWDDGSSVTGITTLHSVGESILVGSDRGLGIVRGLSVSALTSEEGGLVEGDVEAIGGGSLTELHAVIDGRLYRLSGRAWTDQTAYTVAIDDSLEKIAERYSIYGTDQDKQLFIDRYTRWHAANQGLTAEVPVADTMSVSDSAGMAEIVTDSIAPVEPAETTAASGVPGVDRPLVPGEVISVPMVAGLKGRATSIFVDIQRRVWVGTDHGVFYFDGGRWIAHGYQDHVVAESETLDQLAAQRFSLSDQEMADYLAVLRDINDLGSSEPEVGSTVRLYANPAALPVNTINGDGRKISIATESGLIEYTEGQWELSSLKGMTRSNIVGVNNLGSESWIASDESMVIKGRGHSELSLMHVNWLPELADDLYYEFLSVVTSKEGWGTFGGSITFISYGSFVETDAFGNVIGQFDSYDFAAGLSYGTSLTNNLKWGITAKFIYSRLAPVGQGKEQGTGKATGFGIDLGLLYNMGPRLTFGMALTNLGPKLTYIDAAQSDELPRNMAVGFSYKLMRSDYIGLLITAEVNKLMVGLDDDLSEEAKQTVINGGAEFTYADLFAARAGYIYDQEGDIKTPTVGFGLSPFSWGEFDFAYIPSQDDFSLANTLRISLRIII